MKTRHTLIDCYFPLTASACILVLGTLFLSGCATPAGKSATAKTSFQVDNVFTRQSSLPPGLRRVLVLPLAGNKSNNEFAEGCKMLDPILLTELTRAEDFEVVPASPESLEHSTGQPTWSSTEALPSDFFQVVRRLYLCDAVMFCELTAFRPYPPLVIGWRLKLVDVHTQNILWSADEVFDASQPGVLSTSWRTLLTGNQTEADWTIRNSPRLFGQNAADQLFATLPKPVNLLKF